MPIHVVPCGWSVRTRAAGTPVVRHRAPGAKWLALLAVTLLGCGSHGSSSSKGPDPVPECQEYERLFNSCTGQKAAIATQPAALSSSEARRAELKELCVANLNRLKVACR
jgi:hypothetical protein